MTIRIAVRKMLTLMAVTFCLSGVVTPAIASYANAPASTEQVGVQSADGTQAVAAPQTQDGEDDGAVMLILGGGLLLIILFVVIATVSSVSAAVAVAGNMEVEEE